MQKGNSTTNTVLIIILVIVVGLVVWYFTGNRNAEVQDNTDDSAGIRLEVGDVSDNSTE